MKETHLGWCHGYVLEFDGRYYDLEGTPMTVDASYWRTDYFGKPGRF